MEYGDPVLTFLVERSQKNKERTTFLGITKVKAQS